MSSQLDSSTMSVDEESFPSPPEDTLVDIFIHWFLVLAAIIQVIFIFSAMFYSNNDTGVSSSHPNVVNRGKKLKKVKKH
ncbi:unnamed protein product [Trichobilharzia szidati]|nr:unnamed protein product [Trichobilharzia szidati]